MQEQLTKTSQRMQRRIDHLVDEYSQIRAGRANPALLEKIKIDYYGTPTPISQVASISVAEARTLTIQPWDASVIRDIERAIQTSDLGINPQNDGKILRIIFPPLTEDRRKEIVKDISKLAEETKVQIRNVRRECMEKLKAMKKDGELTEDDLKQAEKKTQDLTDKFVKKTDELSSAKQKEIMEI
ncbi:MAG: ribosome recycling factor [bacterium]|nr:ribosome recycling factor [bacterium]MDD6225525.1 ribosome recycling factor [bacterium]